MDIVWNCEIRADMIDPVMVRIMRRAGCRQVLMGIETGSPRLLELVRKDITVDEIRRAARVLHENDVEVYAMMVNGLPTERDEDVDATDRLLREIRPDFTEFLTYMPYPGTPLYDLAVQEGFPEPDNLEEWANMGTFNIGSIDSKGVSGVADERYEEMARNVKKRAIRSSYIREMKNAPLTAPIRGLRFLFNRGRE